MKWELKDYFIKNRLIEPFEKLNLKNGGKYLLLLLFIYNNIFLFLIEDKELNDSQKEIFSLLNNYYDLFYPILNLNKTNEIRNAYMLHALNHIFKVRDTILKNNFKIAKAKSQNKEIENIKDSGFTRAKVLILVPFKSVALDIVNKLCDLSGCDQIQNKAKFLNEYQLPKGTIDPVKNNTKLPEDHRQIFSGNTEDYFKLGIKLTRKTLKLYTSFYQSDIILASPLALRLGTEQKEYDFLSSIEIVILDQLDHLCMQNSEHLHHLFSKLNQVPTEARDVDFSRVKSHYLNQQAEFNCQLITLSQIITPEIQALFHKYSKNVEGKIQYFEPVLEGQYLKIENPVSHKLFRILSNGQLTQQDELRFEYFKNNILPQLNQKLQFEKKVMLFINNYFDFVKVKNYLKLLNFEFGTISEYSSIKEVSKYRNWLKIGKINLILYTERCHFYRRYKIQDINEIIFYSLPDYCNYYNELIDNIQLDSLNNKINITILFSKWDELKLNGIFGTKNTRSFIHGNRDQINF
ncbi:DUF1253-domain-containing protein [Neoconidiobolus thromboides FSU 785]|nr:DUF1253-domain-containing protein [Neoconidiobolus thromboides FSU 785]